MFLHEPGWLWVVLHLVLAALFCADGWLRRGARAGDDRATTLHAVWATVLWIAAALLFAGLIYHALNRQAATEYLAGYGMEEALSIDNLFVFLVLFRSLHLDVQQQRRIFFWGLAGAFFLRACAIAAGVSIFRKFFWVQICTGGFLIVTAVHMLAARRQPQKPSWMGRLAQMLGLKVASRQKSRGQYPWRKREFLLTLLFVQIVDLLFAMDSIPAVLAVTHNLFIVYASNIFAVAGMRALYFVIAGFLERLSLLHYGLGAILLLAGAKLLLAPIWTVSATATLAALGFILAVTAGASLLHGPSSKHSVRR